MYQTAGIKYLLCIRPSFYYKHSEKWSIDFHSRSKLLKYTYVYKINIESFEIKVLKNYIIELEYMLKYSIKRETSKMWADANNAGLTPFRTRLIQWNYNSRYFLLIMWTTIHQFQVGNKVIVQT